MSDQDKPRLIEVAFPLKQASLDSVHEKNVRHGHISTLHIWPARRPLAACRAALIATLLPDPGNEAERNILLEKLAGKVKKENTYKNVNGRKIPVVKESTEGGILHWGRESGPDLDFFREEIKKAYGGRAPRVLDPFAGGGAIPLEAMRLGCEVTAADINPVAWFILKCTLEYPQRLAGQKRPLPQFALESPEFMAKFLKTEKKAGKKKDDGTQSRMLEVPEADLAGHVRAWGYWVLERAKNDLERFYPTVDGKPTVAYLWARTVTCKNCRATLPLLKTLWLCRNDKKRIRLRMKPRTDRTGVDFETVNEPVVGSNAAQRRAHDHQVGLGTKSKSGAWCPVCGGPGSVAMTQDDIREEMKAQALAGRAGIQMTATVVDGKHGKEYRLPIPSEVKAEEDSAASLGNVFKDMPFGLPDEPIFEDAKGSTWCVQYGFDQWYKLFTLRQLLALGTFVKHTRSARDTMISEGLPPEWVEAIISYLACAISRLLDFANSGAQWKLDATTINHSFVRFALPISWDFAEGNPIGSTAGSYKMCFERIVTCLETYRTWYIGLLEPCIQSKSAVLDHNTKFDAVVTDPPYYNAIPYSNIMDFFHVWLRRTLNGVSQKIDSAFSERFAPKWDTQENDGELVDDATRFGGDREKSRTAYEDGMFRSFAACERAMNSGGRLVVVFANKQPEAWERLASALIRAGFVVDATWPIQTEQVSRMRAQGSAALSSSVWLVCRKRPESARPGWEDQVLEDMRSRIGAHLNQFWDAGIRGPDLIWAATGPALEAYSRHPFVKKADQPDAVMLVSEFLRQVRRMVVDYVVGHLLSTNGNGHATEGLDDVTLYYLLHRQSFGFDEAPVGACILYAQSCKIADRDLTDRFDILAHGKGQTAEVDEDEDSGDEGGEEAAPTSGSVMKLKKWDQRLHKDLGLNQAGKVAPLIDQVHRIMQLWRAGDIQKVDTYIEQQGLRRNSVFPRLVQALIELAGPDTDERRLLESIQNQITARGAHPQTQQMHLPGTEEV